MAGYHALIAKPFDPTRVAEAVEEFARADAHGPTGRASWTVSPPRDGTIHVAFVGNVGASDMRACAERVASHLQEETCEVVADFRRLVGFSMAAVSVAERRMWPVRHAIRHVTVVGGPRAARLVAAAACRALGLPCTLEKD
jgi:hypothetical protein